MSLSIVLKVLLFIVCYMHLSNYTTSCDKNHTAQKYADAWSYQIIIIAELHSVHVCPVSLV